MSTELNFPFSTSQVSQAVPENLTVGGTIASVGNISSSGDITGKKIGVFAYMTAPGTTTVVSAGTYYPINGTFSNSPIEGFITTADLITVSNFTTTINEFFD